MQPRKDPNHLPIYHFITPVMLPSGDVKNVYTTAAQDKVKPLANYHLTTTYTDAEPTLTNWQSLPHKILQN
jgi:hypothetical protein